ncbi:MAG: MogA/MoaB family molybdenum cofactor biosynthesis protein [Clostridiales bacterium]
MYRTTIITISDKGFAGQREDGSGPLIREIVEKNGFSVVSTLLLPDEQAWLSRELARICDSGQVDLILTTGGTGFSPRDCTPEATAAVAERLVPGIGEAMRWHSMQYTKRAMLSRAIAVIRKKTLIINLPGSPKAVKENLEFIIDTLAHGLDMLLGEGSADCAAPLKP